MPATLTHRPPKKKLLLESLSVETFVPDQHTETIQDVAISRIETNCAFTGYDSTCPCCSENFTCPCSFPCAA